MLRLENLTKSFGGRTLFADASLHVHPGDRIGLVGRNGEGKTTLLRILAGAETPDGGQIHRRTGARVGYLKQEVSAASARTVLAEAATAQADLHAIEAKLRGLEDEIAACSGHVPDSLAERYDHARHEFERRGGFAAEAELKSTLTGLGLGPEKWEKPLAELSGGWLMRVELAKLLLARPEVLLLDEPTNHLDLPSIRWFEGVLEKYPGAVIVVSHDRTFLDRHVNRIAQLESGRITLYKGNWSSYARQREEREGEAEARRANLTKAIEHAEEFVSRFKAKASKASQAQSRVKQVEKLKAERASLPEAQGKKLLRVKFQSAARSGEVVLRIERAAKAYPALQVYRALDFELRRGDRVALVGPNGAGKSTLLRMAAQALEPDSGTVELGHNVRLGFYAQHQVDALDPSQTVLGELSEDAKLDEVPRLRGILGAFLFSGDDVDKSVSVLSGGEKARLALAKLLLTRANFLVLDEPTNHLDVEARDVLTRALADFDGALLFVSHDRRFIDALASRVVEITRGDGDARVREFLGGFAEYEEMLDRGEKKPEPVAAKPAASLPAPKRKQSKNELSKLRERARALEQRIEAAEKEVEHLDWLASDPETARAGERMRALLASRVAKVEQLRVLYEEWERATAEADAAT